MNINDGILIAKLLGNQCFFISFGHMFQKDAISFYLKSCPTMFGINLPTIKKV